MNDVATPSGPRNDPMNAPMKPTTLSTSFFAQLTQKRLFAARIADLAATLAEQAGEGAQRPLTRAQLERALCVNLMESAVVMDLVLEWAGRERARGAIGEDDVFFTD